MSARLIPPHKCSMSYVIDPIRALVQIQSLSWWVRRIQKEKENKQSARIQNDKRMNGNRSSWYGWVLVFLWGVPWLFVYWVLISSLSLDFFGVKSPPTSEFGRSVGRQHKQQTKEKKSSGGERGRGC